ncbi:proteasome inhibitor PI31 subunit-like [Centruroides sculpturatus]|uniref:proteasome inhibitor PI31 subunit-like n=1 Tax=Centruroides sculpturatus TaxID=218467 RepID=UPI000C6CAD13|nr:proteasome inhibitor PI31 subunit-like [Centruroides sculpturatus]
MSVGLEICFSTVKDTLRSKTDALVAFIHWEIISGGKKCVGLDEKWPDTKEQGSELLPANWNQNQEIYTIRYISENSERFLLKIVKSDQFILISVINVSKNKASGASIKISDHVSDDYKDFTSAYRQVKEIKQNLSKMFVDIEGEKTQTSIPVTSQDHPVTSDPLRSDIFRQPQNPLRIGEGDLDPLGLKDGGMLMDPRGFPRLGAQPPLGIPGQLPRGAIPPGARFDPFGPGGFHPRHFGPDPDHFPPPGSSDMFM